MYVCTLLVVLLEKIGVYGKVPYKVKTDFAKVGCECVEWIHLIQDIALGQAVVMTVWSDRMEKAL